MSRRAVRVQGPLDRLRSRDRSGGCGTDRRRGAGYETNALTNLITSTDVWARYVLKQFLEHFGNTPEVRALGFCVGVDHARYMARVFEEHGVRARAVLGTTGDEARKRADAA
jgi:hypothetical protein